jgi:hypothetical protein
MNLLNDTWRGLVRRKLWPVALLLVGALVAVPVMLAKEPEVAPAPANAAAANDEALPATYVTAAGGEDTTDEGEAKRRRTLGETKDPFEPAPLPKAKKTKKKSSSSAKTDTSSSSKTTDSSGGSESKDESGGTSAPTPPAVTPTPTATPAPAPANSIKVRFSRTETADEAKAKTVERLEVLPSIANPVLVYRGVEENGKVAVFEITGSVTAEGDGQCDPAPDDCQYLKLRAGEIEFITIDDTGEATDAQYQLELIEINAKSTASAAKLKKAEKAGTTVLSELERTPGYAFDETTGTLQKLNVRAASRLKGAALRKTF